jgi:hypothetical protein
MALEVVVPRKIGRAVWALVTLRGWRFWIVLAVTWKTHLASWGAWIGFWWHRSRKRERAIAWVVAARVWCDELMRMLLVMLWWVLWRTFPVVVTYACGSFRSRSIRRITVAEAGDAGRARLHVIAGDTGVVVGDNERLRGLVGLSDVHLNGALRGIRGVAHGLTAPIQTLQCRNSGIGTRLPR